MPDDTLRRNRSTEIYIYIFLLADGRSCVNIPSRDTNKYSLTNDRTLLYLYEDADEVKHITTIAPQY